MKNLLSFLFVAAGWFGCCVYADEVTTLLSTDSVILSDGSEVSGGMQIEYASNSVVMINGEEVVRSDNAGTYLWEPQTVGAYKLIQTVGNIELESAYVVTSLGSNTTSADGSRVRTVLDSCANGCEITDELKIDYLPDGDKNAVVTINGEEVINSDKAGVYVWKPTVSGLYEIAHTVGAIVLEVSYVVTSLNDGGGADNLSTTVVLDSCLDGEAIVGGLEIDYLSNGDKNAIVTINGEVVVNSDKAGVYVWKPEAVGVYTLTHTVGSIVLEASYVVSSLEPTPTPEPEPEPEVQSNYHLASTNRWEVFDFDSAHIYYGYLYEDSVSRVSVGTILVKTYMGKMDYRARQITSKVSVAIQIMGERSIKLTGELKSPTSTIEIETKDGRKLYLDFGRNDLAGTFDTYQIDGARDVFSSKANMDKIVAANMLEMLKSRGVMTIAWGGKDGWNGLSVTVGTRGRVKVAGVLVGGAKVSVNAQMIMGEEWCVVPVGYVKKNVKLGFNIWIARDGSAAEVVGLGKDVVVGHNVSFKKEAVFAVDSAALLGLMGEGVYEKYLPEGVAITVNGTKWVLPKAGKVSMKKGVIDESKAGENPAGLKLTYKAKDGSFSGSFKVYANVNGKLKATSVSVSGVMVDGKGYGTATIKKVGSVPIMIE